jgi:hypothetical protein
MEKANGLHEIILEATVIYQPCQLEQPAHFYPNFNPQN